ncbi:MAG: FAD:protein FMN transferase, partial [Desulfitobacterium sp.]|nr:FAD:protein FMN transferase [Desulfitobacterium sp.]
PEDGYPAKNGLVSVSIITKESVDADALSTGIFLLGLEEGMKLIEELPDTEAVFITEDRKVYITSGMNESNLEIVNESYELQSSL